MAPPVPPITVIQNRFLSFLIWQIIQSTLLFIATKTLLLTPLTPHSSLPTSLTFTLSLLSFLFSTLPFSLSFHSLSSPSFRRPAYPPDLAVRLLRLVFTSSSPSDPDFTRRVRVSFGIVLLLCSAAVSGSVGVVSLCGFVTGFWVRGFVVGLLYGLFCVYTRRFLLVFPVVQRPPFFSYKLGLPLAFRQALKLSVAFFFLSGIAILAMPIHQEYQVAGWVFREHFIFYMGCFAVILCWELMLHLYKVLHTKRLMLAPLKGSVAIESNPCETLLATLEESSPGSLLQYLAYFDLSMVCGSNIDSWLGAAIFEETGETYKRVIAVCLRPLDQLASKIAKGSISSADTDKLSHQLSSPTEIRQSSEILELFGDFQLYAWCAQAVASLEVCSHKEDRFGVAQLSGSHGNVLSTLLACLLAVETFMGKKHSLQSPNQKLGPAGIKWATNSTTRREIATAMSKKQGSPSHLKSYALADVLKISIYSIVDEFHEEILASARLGALENDWVSCKKHVYASELLVQKLHFFLNFHAS